MRALLLLLALCMVSACGPQRAARCDLSLTRDLSFTSAEAHDQIIVRSFGATCDKATGLYDIRDEGGHPIWAWAAPLPRAFGHAAAADKPAEMQAFLERWIQPTLTTTHTAPAWAALLPGQTTLDQFTFDDIRARDLPMLCHASGTGREICIFWEPAAGGAGHYFDREIEETPT